MYMNKMDMNMENIDSIIETLMETSEDFSMKLANGKLDVSLVWRVIEPIDEALWYLNLVLQNNGWY